MKAIIQEMLETFILKRKCRLNIRFFFVLLKRMPWLKQAVIEKGLELQNSEETRPAQLRILEKLLKTLVKGKKVKEEHQDQE